MKPKKNYKPGDQDVMLTPPHALEPIFPLLPSGCIIWESATGSERILEKALISKGFKVKGTDIIFGRDYFKTDGIQYDVELSNPPFSLKYEWLNKAFSRGKPFAFIVPYETTFAKDFRVLFEKYNMNPFEIIKLTPERRINFKTPQFGWGKWVFDSDKKTFTEKGNSAQMPTCWLTWGLDASIYQQPLKSFYVPMRSAKYNDQNVEIL
jgi:hypothetical protein